MDQLFVVNRYQDTNEEEDIIAQESKHLERLKQKIEQRKKAFADAKVDTITIEPKQQHNNKLGAYENSADLTETKKENEDVIPDKINNNKKEVKVKEKSAHEFKVLGISDFEKKAKVRRVLPYWLSHSFQLPTKLHDLSCPVEEQSWLHHTLKTTLTREGVKNLFPVQEKVVPFVLKQHSQSSAQFWPQDICVSAPTGSGKTLAFVLPIIQVLINGVATHVRALIVLPVQELAMQVAKVFRKYCTNTGLKVALLSGNAPLRHEQQQIVRYTESLGWVSNIDIVVCTAGRLVEHLQNTEGFSLKHLQFLVIDEADRIMEHIQNDWLYHLERHIKLENQLMAGKGTNLSWYNLTHQKPPPHKLLFSATLSQDPEKLEQWGLFQPKLFSVLAMDEYEDEDNIRKYTTPEELKEEYVSCDAEDKPLILYHLLLELKWDRVLCFTNSSQAAHRLAVLLNTWSKGKINVAELSSALDRSTRESVLKKFTQSEINVLIGTDALARGIDIPDCDYVISYDPPRNIKTYIHRVGRTGRAGRFGHAVTILLQNQVAMFKEQMQAGGKSDLPERVVDAEIFNRLIQSYEAAIQETKHIIQNETTSKVQKSISLKRRPKTKARKRKLDDNNVQ